MQLGALGAPSDQEMIENYELGGKPTTVCGPRSNGTIGRIHQVSLVKPQDLLVSGKLDGKHEEYGEDAV